MSPTRSIARRRDAVREIRKQKRIALMFTAPPIIVFTLFTIAEGFAQGSDWWRHAAQLVTVLLLVGLAWFRSRIGGPMLILAGTAAAAWILMAGIGELGADLVTIMLISLPILISGVLFTRIDDRSTDDEPA